MNALLFFLILWAQGIPVQPNQGGIVSGGLKDIDGSPLPGSYEIEIQIFAHATIHQPINLEDKDVTLEIVSKRL